MKSVADIIYDKFRFRSRHDNLPWSAPRGDRVTLAEVLGAAGLNKGVEVGTQRGRYARVLCEKNPNIELTCIDPWCGMNSKLTQEVAEGYYQIAVKALAGFNVKFMRTFSMDALKEFADESLDFAYIDGAHDFDNAALDIILWSRKVRKGGIVAAHDYLNFYRSGVIEAVNGFVHGHMITPWYVTREQLPTAFWVKP